MSENQEPQQTDSPPSARMPTEILSSMAEGMVVLDADWLFVFVNAEAERLLQKPGGSLIGKRLWETVPHLVGTEAERELKRAAAERTVREYENYDPKLERWFQSKAFPVQSGGLTVLFRDVTEQRRMANRLQEAEEQFRRILQTANEGIWILDRDMRVALVNERMAAMLGYAPHEMLGRSKRDFVSPSEAKRIEALFEHRQAGMTEQADVRLQTRDGREIWTVMAARPIHDAAGGFAGALDMFTDITERKRSEDLLKQEDQRKNEFLAILSHELRNPLAPISNAASILRRIGSKDPHLEWASEVIDRQVKQMTRLIDDLLDIERIWRGTFTIRKEPTTLDQIVTLALETSLPHVNAANQHLKVVLPESPAVLNSDRVRIAQVVSNLLNNATKYTQQEGSIRLSAKVEAAQAVIRVEDNGIGFPSEVASRLFAPFVQLEARAPSSYGGLGVGLSLVHGIVSLHGGTVEACSPGPGKGSVFTVRLPLAAELPKAVPASRAQEAEQRPARPLRILIADDNKDAAETLAEFLCLDEHAVRVVYDGNAALAAAQSFMPEVALLDIGMPGLDGYGVARALRAEHGDAMMLIAITGWGQPMDRRRAMKAGFDEHITKPFDPDELHAVLNRLARGSAGKGTAKTAPEAR